MNQVELQRLAEDRILDAQALIDGRRWAFAYYTAGYAVECSLKSCILARMIHTRGIFEDKKFAEQCWTHDLGKLVDLAGLTAEMGVAHGANPTLLGYWGVVKDWKETSRYEQKTEADARALHEAITQEPDGVLRWIRNHW